MSTVSSSAPLAAKASTSKTKKGKGINYDSEAITKPDEFLMITSSLAQLSCSKILASSKFILYHEISGADQDTTYRAIDEDQAIWGACYKIKLSGGSFFFANMIFGKPRPRLDFGLEIWPKGYR